MLLLLLITPWIWRRIASASLLPAVNRNRVSIGNRLGNSAADRRRKEQQNGSEGGNPIQ
jgi:hypothetical protein